MKYPQLVSTRAVNAISDWLVSRLEQIGVEAPLIYSRLLLSLLHTSVQINDPIEFSNLERYFTNQKGSNKRFLPQCDTETIKKFTAIQCLLDAVSTEQEISCIENLVDELFEKLINLEKQSNDEEEPFIKHHHQLPSTIKSLDIEDPRKRYYRAFPALSKEMEDSVWLTKRNDKSLTWPASNSETSSANNMVALNTTAGVKRKNKRRRNQALNKGRIGSVRKNSYGGNSSPTWDTDFEGNWEMGTDLIKEFLMSQKNRNRSISESDATNFIYEKNTEKRMKPTKQENNLKSSDHLNKVSAVANNSCKIPSTMAYATNNLNKLTNKGGIANNPAVMKDINILIGNNNVDDDMNEYVPYDELTSYKDFDNLPTMARQMYQDEVSYNDDKSSKAALQQQQNDFAQFEAKFNSDVEALWKDNNKDVDNNNSQPASLAPNLNHQRNIDNFWTNYYNHHYNNNSVEEKVVHSLVNKNSRDIKNDFYSLPSNFGTFQSKSETSAEMLTENDLSSVGVFISDSIWSDNGSTIKNAYNDDDSFYNNGWAPKNCEQATDTCDGKEVPNGFNISKWSECSFETPFVPTSANLNIPSNVSMAASAKHLYGGVFKHAVNASTANKTVGPNNLFQQANQQLQSQHQISQPVSLPDYYGSSLCCFASEKTPKITSAMMTAIAPQLQQALTASTTSSTTTTTTTARSVSLTNHSKTSGFIEYSIVKSSSSYFQFNQIAKFDRKNNANNHSRAAIPAAPANSLPSSVLVDGANVAVNISSASSSSPLDDDDNLLTSYRTHFRPIKQNYADGYQFDISGSLDEVEFERSDSGSLYLESEKYFEYTRVDTFLSDEDSSASSICSLNEDNRYRDTDGVSDLKGLYPLKFRMKQNEKQCQTDLSLQMPNAPRVTQGTVANNLNIKSFNCVQQLDCSRDEVDYSTDSECCLNEDEVSIDLDKWSMAEMGKKCADNNNTHTLWGMCPACTKDNKCVPANRLLKDELIIEADEIMSDLKYMQDLYICSDWENDENDTDSELEALKNDDEDDDENGRFGNEDSVNDDDDDDNEEQEQIFYNITKLISDLLKPENAKSLVNALSAGAGNQNKNIFKGISSEDELADNANNSGCLFDYQKNVIWKNVNNNNEKYIGGLWSNDENIIWKREMKPWGNWPRLNDNKTAAFLEKLNWKHANLAAIWKNGSIAGGGEIEVKSSSSSLIENMAKHADNSASDMIAPSSRIALNQTKYHLTPSVDDHIECKSTTTMDPITRTTKNPITWNISSSDAAERLAQRRYQKQPIKGCPIASQTITNRPDRKRRHSASQNISCSGTCSNDSGRVALEWCVADNREMTAKIGGCNKVEIMAKWESDSSKLSSLINVDDSLSSSSLSPKTTIITCKYWTTMDTTLASPYFMDKSSLYDGIGAMTLNPSSILRHVAVVSRPLTR